MPTIQAQFEHLKLLGAGADYLLHYFSTTIHLQISSGPDLTAYCDGVTDTGLSRIPPFDPVLHIRPP
jgi:hypothetical protein